MEKQGFSGIGDVDRELLLRMDDREFIKVCTLNKYFINLCRKNNYLLFKRKLQIFYPEVLKFKIKKYKNETWKKYYAYTVKTIALLKEKYDFEYTTGNPFLQLSILESSRGYPTNLLQYAMLNQEFPLVKYVVQKHKPNISANAWTTAGLIYDSTILRYLVEHGGDISNLRFINRDGFTPENILYIKSIGL